MLKKTLEEMESDSREKIIIDVRDPEEYSVESYPDSQNIYIEEISLDDLGTDSAVVEEYCHKLIDGINDTQKPIYLICYSGLKSDIIADKMQSLGYECYSLAEGYRCIMRRNVQNYLKKSEEVTESDTSTQYVKDVERSLVKKFRKDIWCKFTKAINPTHKLEILVK